MDRYSTQSRILAAALAIGSIVLSSYAIVHIHSLYLPIPLAIAIINLIIPIIALAAVLLSKRASRTNFTPIFAALASASTYLPFVLLILSFVYGVPSDLLSCAVERRWRHFFQNRNMAIGLIQDRLQCCGFNSLADQAWPFPSRDVDARACERTLHYTRRCADVWLRQESHTATAVGFASFLNWLLLVFLLTARRDIPWFGVSSVDSVNQRLLGGEPERRITETYEDEPQRQH